MPNQEQLAFDDGKKPPDSEDDIDHTHFEKMVPDQADAERGVRYEEPDESSEDRDDG